MSKDLIVKCSMGLDFSAWPRATLHLYLDAGEERIGKCDLREFARDMFSSLNDDEHLRAAMRANAAEMRKLADEMDAACQAAEA